MAKPNGYSLFVKETARQREREGKPVNIGKLFKELGSQWQNLSETEKQRYKDKAKSQSQNEPSYDSFPRRPVSEIKIQSNPIKVDDKSFMLKPEPSTKIETKVCLKRSLSTDDEEKDIKKPKIGLPGWKKKLGMTGCLEARSYFDQQLLDMYTKSEQIIKSRSNFIDIPLYSLSFNVLCKQKKAGEVFFIPIEVGICAYSIKRGKLGTYHALIDAGCPPQNYLNAASDHAQKHKITFPPRDRYPHGSRTDYKKIYQEILEYTKTGERTVLISQARDYTQTIKCLDWLYNKAIEDGTKLPRVSTWTVLPIIEFLASMHDNIFQGLLGNSYPQFANRYFMKTLMETNTLEYNPALRCHYHEKGENETAWCALNCAQKAMLSLEPILATILTIYKCATEIKSLPPVEQFPSITLNQDPRQNSSQNNQLVCVTNIDSEPHEAPLPIEGPNKSSNTPVDPRLMHGNVKPLTDAEMSTLMETDPEDIVFFDEDLGLFPEPKVRNKPKPKPTEPTIVASGPVSNTDNPPDIF